MEIEIGRAIERFLEHRRLKNCAAGTLRVYTHHLSMWRSWMERQHLTTLDQVEIDAMRGYFVWLRDEYEPFKDKQTHRQRLSPAALNASYRTVRAYWYFCADERWLTEEQIRFFKRIGAPTVKRKPRYAQTRNDVQRLLDACGEIEGTSGHDEAIARNRAIVLLLWESGMRISELCSLTDEAVDFKRRKARIEGKGGQWRPVFWRSAGAAALARYLLLRRGERGTGPLFRGTSHRNNGGGFTQDSVRATLKRLAEDAGIPLPKGAPIHSFRHGFARAAIAEGADISDISQLLGHRSLTTTMIYLTEDEDRLADTYDRIFRQSNRRDSARMDAPRHDRKSVGNDQG